MTVAAAVSDPGPVFDRRFLRNLRRLSLIYWGSPAARVGALLLALAVALELCTVYGNLLLADAQKRVFDAVQDKQAAAFFSAMGSFCGIVLLFVLVSAYRVYRRLLAQRPSATLVTLTRRPSLAAHHGECWFMDEHGIARQSETVAAAATAADPVVQNARSDHA